MKELEKRREERLLQEKQREVKNVCLFAFKNPFTPSPFFFRMVVGCFIFKTL